MRRSLLIAALFFVRLMATACFCRLALELRLAVKRARTPATAPQRRRVSRSSRLSLVLDQNWRDQ